MNESFNVENASEEKNALYSTKFLMSKELFYDFYSVNYNRIKKFFLVLFCFFVYLIGSNLLFGDQYFAYDFGSVLSLFMILICFRQSHSTKISYERNLLSEGKESTATYELFEDKIVSHVDELKREYFYHQITKFYETKSFILLHLKHNLYITIEKSNLNADVDEVKSFLIDKCTGVKKKKFINCVNDKKWTFAFLIAVIVITVIGTVIGTISVINAFLDFASI